jgi:uncharacterized membrane-anchored protein
MQTRHVPTIDPRYWVGILFASIFGTNLGDFYAHHSGLGLGPGLLVLVAVFATTYWIETKDRATHEIYYWLAIIIIRTGATNIADYLAFRVRIPALPLAIGLTLIIALLGWRASVSRTRLDLQSTRPTLTETNLSYWGAMLGAGVFGTAVGDMLSHRFGQGPAAIALGLMLAILLAATSARVATRPALYWCAVALARTAGTCMGDWFAENKTLHTGLSISTLLTGTAFIAILTCWRSPRRDAKATP